MSPPAPTQHTSSFWEVRGLHTHRAAPLLPVLGVGRLLRAPQHSSEGLGGVAPPGTHPQMGLPSPGLVTMVDSSRKCLVAWVQEQSP